MLVPLLIGALSFLVGIGLALAIGSMARERYEGGTHPRG